MPADQKPDRRHPNPSGAGRRRAALALLAVLLPAAAVARQGPDAPWQTLTTESYRIHYPAPAEDWVLHLARRLEPLRGVVEAEVGWADPAVVDVLIQDPAAAPNGFAWPVPGSPRLVLWLTPPTASSQLARFHDWSELLAIHEQAHLSHLMRPSRNPLERHLERHFLPVRGIALRSPRWLSEGYATVLEGRLTGAGRPHAHLRAALLRRWAQEGRLPSYARLAGDRERWMGMAMAYLAGSAYLEWLEQRAGPESLRHLFRRMTSRERRSFDGAFRGTFGGSPPELWARFAAELTHSAIEAERRLAPVLREGERWQRHDWGVGAPAVSPDGERLAYVRLDRERPPRLLVLSTTVDEEEVERRRQRQERLLARDPEDVAAVEVEPPPREVLHQLELPRSTVPHAPRWLADGSLLLTQALPDSRGVLRADLYRWRPGASRLERITHRSDVRHGDPAPDGAWAVAVRSRWGKTELVRVDLADGAVAPLTGEPRVDVIYDAPRLSPAGDRLAYLRHREGSWELVVRDLATGGEERVPTSQGADLAEPAWSADGSHLYLVVGAEGMLDLQAFPVAGRGAPHQVTRSRGAALAPAPAPDGRYLYYLSLEPDGLDLRLLDLDAATVQDAAPLAGVELVPAVPPGPPTEVPRFPAEALSQPRPYGLGRGEWDSLTGGGAGATGSWMELGVRGGDLVGRWEVLALGSLADGGAPEGAAVAASLRRYRLPVTLQLFAVEEEPSRQPLAVPGLGALLDLSQRGFALGTAADHHLAGGVLRARLEGVWSEVEPAGGAARTRRLLGLDLGGDGRLERGPWRLAGVAGVVGQTGETAGDGWRLLAGNARASLAHGALELELAWDGRSLSGSPGPAERLRLGGLPATVLPVAAVALRILEPALPAGVLHGTRSESWRLSAARRGAALRPFWARHTLRDRAGLGGEGRFDLAGLETELVLPAFPLLRLPELSLQAGVARLLDPPFEGKHRGWVALTYRP